MSQRSAVHVFSTSKISLSLGKSEFDTQHPLGVTRSQELIVAGDRPGNRMSNKLPDLEGTALRVTPFDLSVVPFSF
jgi:hypothetical protein